MIAGSSGASGASIAAASLAGVGCDIVSAEDDACPRDRFEGPDSSLAALFGLASLFYKKEKNHCYETICQVRYLPRQHLPKRLQSRRRAARNRV